MSEGKTLAGFVDRLEHREDTAFLIRMKREGSDRWSYGKLAEDSLSLARGLYAKTSDQKRVGLFAEPGFESIAAALGVIRSGLSVLLMDVQYSGQVIGDILTDSGVKLVFTTSRHADRLKSVASDIELGILDAKDEDKNSWKRFFAAEGDLPDPAPEHEAALFYTSGTTGPPKGVPLSHKNLVFQLDTVVQTGLIDQGDRLLLPLPLHHVYPFVIGTLVPLSMGLSIVLPGSLTGPQLIRALDEGQVTVVLGVPRLYRAIFSGIRSRFSSKGILAEYIFDGLLGFSIFLRKMGFKAGKFLFKPLRKKIGPKLNILASGGSPLDPDLAWKLEGLGWKVAIGYGLTETSPLLTINPPGSAMVESIGKAIPGVKIRFDPSAVPEEAYDGHEGNNHHEIGEIMAKGPGVFSGYLNLPEKTGEAFADGWFKTGDLGRQDNKGYFYVTGRVSTLIITEQGENIQPDHVEKALEEHPVISEAGVLQKDGKLVALLVPDPAEIRKRKPEDIREVVRGAVIEQSRKLPSYQHLADFAVTRETLPRTRLGKIKRHLLQDRYERAGQTDGGKPQQAPMAPEEMSDQDRAMLENIAARQTWEWLADRYSDSRLSADTSLRLDLGVDSMEWLNITMEIRERAGVEITDEAIGRIETVRDLLQEVMEASGEKQSPASLDEPEKIITARQKKFLQPQSPAMKQIAKIMIKVNRLLVRSMFKVESRGMENIPEGQVVFTPNHVSYLDPFVLASALTAERLEDTFWTGFTGAAYHNPVNAFVSRLAKTIPIDPEKGVFMSLASAAYTLKNGRSLVWFPEGRRSPSGELQPFRPGIGVLLQHYDVPVVPVFIRGTEAAMPVGRVIPKAARVIVTFGDPVLAGQLEQKGKGKEARDKIADSLQQKVARLKRQ
ncbi:MAG: AMP-binding protein [Desulfobacterales bacterium]